MCIRDSFETIAAHWTAHLRGRYGELATIKLDSADVAAMSAMIKLARLAETPDHEDSWVDLAGYAACGFQVTRAETGSPLTQVRVKEIFGVRFPQEENKP